jgi:transcriptional regulator with XRE-family HTH domain
MFSDTFANRLKKALNMRKMKPAELAEKARIDKSLISNYLSGNYKAKQDKLTTIAKVLDVNPVWLMGYDEDAESTPIKLSTNDYITLPFDFYPYKEKDKVRIIDLIYLIFSYNHYIENMQEIITEDDFQELKDTFTSFNKELNEKAYKQKENCKFLYTECGGNIDLVEEYNMLNEKKYQLEKMLNDSSLNDDIKKSLEKLFKETNNDLTKVKSKLHFKCREITLELEPNYEYFEELREEE